MKQIIAAPLSQVLFKPAASAGMNQELSTGQSWVGIKRFTRFNFCRLEVIAISMILGVGYFGWQTSVEEKRNQISAAFQLETNQFLVRIEQELVNLGGALEDGIARSRQSDGALEAINWSVLSRHLNQGSQKPDLGGAGLAVPRSYRVRRSDDEQPGQIWSANLATGAGISPTKSILKIVRSHDHAPEDYTLGTDMFESGSARDSALRARDTGHAVLHLATDRATTKLSSRAWLYAPTYAIDAPWSLQDRRSQFVGLVFAPVDLERILFRVATEFPHLIVSAQAARTLLMNGKSANDAVLTGWRPQDVTVKRFFLGAQIDFQFKPTATFGSVIMDFSSLLWPLNALLSTALLLSVVAFRSRSANRALQKIAGISENQGKHITELERDTANLESFAYVVSHDLRTPLRKLQALSDVLAEEIEDWKTPGRQLDNSADVDDCLRRMCAQAERMDVLIAGIHEYSQANVREDRVEELRTRESIESVAQTLGIPIDQLHLHGNFPTIQTWSVRFEQVMANLIGNAFKYHDKPDDAKVDVSISAFGDYCLFSVRDNGPGIDPKNHERIFQVFESIKVPGVESSGVGLAIVRESVESVGGRVFVESSIGEGSTFRFTWPKDISQH